MRIVHPPYVGLTRPLLQTTSRTLGPTPSSILPTVCRAFLCCPRTVCSSITRIVSGSTSNGELSSLALYAPYVCSLRSRHPSSRLGKAPAERPLGARSALDHHSSRQQPRVYDPEYVRQNLPGRQSRWVHVFRFDITQRPIYSKGASANGTPVVGNASSGGASQHWVFTASNSNKSAFM